MRNVLSRQHTASVPRSRPDRGGARRTGSRRRRILVLIRCLGLTMIAVQAIADDALRHFDIQSQGAASALTEFARQADITLVFASSLVAQHQSVTVRGDFTVIEALRRLLDGTGLAFKQISATTIAISAASATGGSQDPPNETQTKGDTSMNHRGLFTRIAGLFALSGAVLAGGHAYGQEEAAQAGQAPANQVAPADASAANTADLQEIVVTATASGGIRKLDASFQITTASLEEIRDVGPSSSADLLKIVPGVWAESGGGEAGPNIELAGYPSGSGAPYVTYSINGSPVYPSHNLSFLDDSSMFRLDDTVERAEVVLGGPSVVFSDGQLGATANFILRQGTANPHGDLGLTVGSEGMYRLDGFYGGPLSESWFASFGGFYRESDGVRPSQFPADDGGQLTATLSHSMDQGTIMFYARVLNDKNLFITDMPLSVTGSGTGVHYSGFPGFNPLTGWYAGSAVQGLSVQECPGCAPLTANLADGRGANLHTFGSDLDLHISDTVSLSNKLQFTGGDMPTAGLFNGSNTPVTMSSYIASAIATANASKAAVAAAGVATTGTATYVGSGAAVNPNTYVETNGFWVVDKVLQTFTDDLRFTFELVPGNNLTVGSYFAAYSSNDNWNLGNTELMTATPNAQLIGLTLNNGAVMSYNGLIAPNFFTLIDRFQGLNAALFASDQWRMGPLLVDAGFRMEEEKVDGTIENDTSEPLDNNPLHFYNNNVSVPNGTWSVVNCETTLRLGNDAQCDVFEKTKGSWTTGGTYELSQHMSVYARVDQGNRFPSFDDLRSGDPEIEGIRNYEVGYRVQTATIYADVDVFDRTFNGVPFQQFVVINGVGTNLVFTYGSDSKGLDFTAHWQPIEHLSLGVTGDWQDSTYTGIVVPGGAGKDGNVLQRQPRFQARFTPEYDVPMGWGGLRFFATYSYVGLRYSDPGNAQVLPAFDTLDAGIVADMGQNFELRLQGTNLTNELGLTEANARTASGSNSAAGGFTLGRPIFGREVNLGLKYKF
jgi:outer membrane receptor protein involved in Fe transport